MSRLFLARFLLVMMGLLLAACATEQQIQESPTDTVASDDQAEPQVDIKKNELPLVEDTGFGEDIPDFFVAPEVVAPDINEEDFADNPPEVTVETAAPDIQEEGTSIKELQESADSLTCVVQYGAMLVGVDITLKQVVVTAPPYPFQFVGEKLHGYYLMDPEGGPYSGIHATYSSAQVPELIPGMVVTVVGDHKESSCFTLFQAKSILVDSEGPAPEPYLTTPADIMADPESFEGVFVRIESVTVTDANPDINEGYDHHEFVVDELLRVGNDYELKYMTLPTDAREVGDVFQYIVGVVKFADDSFHLMPRTNGDLLLEGDEPPADDPFVEYVETMADVVEQPDIVEGAFEIIEDVPTIPDVPVVPDAGPLDIAPDIPDTPDSPIVITEIMADPDGIPDDKGEWLEIVNATDEAVDINGWRLEDLSGQMHIIMNGGPYLVQPGQVLVLGSNAIESSNGGVEVNYQYPYSDFKIANDSDVILLKNLYGEEVDAVYYDKYAGWKVPKGASIELMHANLDNNNAANWVVATTPYGDGTNLGTPGELP
jgi:hypothetical protein